MRKIIPLVLILFLIINQGYIYSTNLINDELNKIPINLFKDFKLQEGYVAKLVQGKVYFNLGRKAGVTKGEVFKVVHQGGIIKDPINSITLGKIETQIAVIKVIEVKDQFSIAQVKEYYSKDKIEVGDRVVLKDKKIGIINFNHSGLSPQIFNKVRKVFKNYLKDNNRFKLIKLKKIESLISKLNLESRVTKDDLGLIANKLGADLLLTGDIYKGEKEIFIRSQLFSNISESIIKEEIITIPKSNQSIEYYQNKYKEQKISYRLFFKSELFGYPSGSLAIGDINNDGQKELVLNTKNSLKVLNYRDDKLVENWSIDEYQITDYDDYKLVIDSVEEGFNGIIVENYNRLFKYKWDGSSYLKKELNGFNKNRPKIITKLREKEYLITRDYHHLLKFNLWQDKNYQIDFQLPLNINEGYRIGLGDIDDNNKPELVITSYTGDNYKIKVYSLKGRLKYTFPNKYGSGIVIMDLDQDENQEVFLHTNHQENNKLLAFSWNGTGYDLCWKSETISGEIRDLIAGDIDSDGEEELVTLVTKGDKSRIYAFEVNPYFARE